MMEAMSSFEMLAMVASQNYVQAYEAENLVPEAKKTSRKRHASSDTWTFEEVKALSPKALVGRFAEFTSDEITKKYYYHCRFLPGKCSKTEWSFGNEQKAWNRMKVHLKAHLNEQSSELDLRVFVKSPSFDENSNHANSVQKPSKVLAKPKFVSETESSSDNDSQYSIDCFKSKKMLEFDAEPGSTARRKQPAPKHKSIQPNGWSFPAFSTLPPFQNWGRYNEIPSSDESETGRQSAPWDHDYADVRPFSLSCDPCEEEPEPAEPPPKRKTVQKQFVIKTPKFPYLHAMEEYVVAEIVEIDWEGNAVGRRQRTADTDCLDIRSYVREEETSCVELLPVGERRNVTGSVLECVENKVSKKCSAAPKISYSSSDNEENSENVKRVKKEQALKHITQLNSKKKKQCQQGPLLCQLCEDGRQFTAVASLMHHYRSHAGIKLYVCEICQDTFTRQHSLNYHMMIHQNRSRFECEVCGRTFRHPSHFKEHMRRHTGETPFQCSICDMLFKTRNTYKRHLRMQHNKILTAHGIVDDTSQLEPPAKKSKKNSQ